MESKQAILSAIRQHSIPAIDRPDLDGDWIQFDDPVSHFSSVLETVGGRAVLVEDVKQINAELANIPAYAEAAKVFSRFEGAGKSNVDLDAIDDPHDLEDLDFAILPAEFGVAENGALWVTDDGLKQRVIYFIVQHLALVVSADQIVNNMNEAYRRLEFDRSRFGAFISGPSKTADIEQSLVIGAHGSRSLTVFICGS